MTKKSIVLLCLALFFLFPFQGFANETGKIQGRVVDKNLQAERMSQLSVVSEPDKFSNYNAYFNLGGPIVKDKL